MGMFSNILGTVGGIVGLDDSSAPEDADRIENSQLNDVNEFKPRDYFAPLANSHFSELSTDPTTRAAQMKALTQLGQVAGQGGYDTQSQQATAAALNQANANERSQRGAILQNAQSRGLGGSGAELAGLLGAQQGNANTAQAGSLQAGSDARNRALASLANYGNLAGNIRGQDYSQAADAARAEDSRDVANANVSAQRANAQLAKLGLLGKARGTIISTDNAKAAQAIAEGTGVGQAIGSIPDTIISAEGGGGGGGGGGGMMSGLSSLGGGGGGGGGGGSGFNASNFSGSLSGGQGLQMDPSLFQGMGSGGGFSGGF